MQGLSAGRVQSVATRLVVERERERMAFVAAHYWDIVATFDPRVRAKLSAVDGKKVAQGRDFARTGELTTADTVALDEDDAPASPPRSRAPLSRFARSSASRTRAGRPRRS